MGIARCLHGTGQGHPRWRMRCHHTTRKMWGGGKSPRQFSARQMICRPWEIWASSRCTWSLCTAFHAWHTKIRNRIVGLTGLTMRPADEPLIPRSVHKSCVPWRSGPASMANPPRRWGAQPSASGHGVGLIEPPHASCSAARSRGDIQPPLRSVWGQSGPSTSVASLKPSCATGSSWTRQAMLVRPMHSAPPRCLARSLALPTGHQPTLRGRNASRA